MIFFCIIKKTLPSAKYIVLLRYHILTLVLCRNSLLASCTDLSPRYDRDVSVGFETRVFYVLLPFQKKRNQIFNLLYWFTNTYENVIPQRACFIYDSIDRFWPFPNVAELFSQTLVDSRWFPKTLIPEIKFIITRQLTEWQGTRNLGSLCAVF